MKLIKLKCTNCGAMLDANKDLDKIHCNYCGEQILIDDEATKLNRIEEVKLKTRKENHEQFIKEQKEISKLEWEEMKQSMIVVFICLGTILTIGIILLLLFPQ